MHDQDGMRAIGAAVNALAVDPNPDVVLGADDLVPQ